MDYQLSTSSMTNEHERMVEEATQIIDVHLNSSFNAAVRQCMRFVRNEQTEEEMREELALLNKSGLKHIKCTLTTLITKVREEERDKVAKTPIVTHYFQSDNQAANVAQGQNNPIYTNGYDAGARDMKQLIMQELKNDDKAK